MVERIPELQRRPLWTAMVRLAVAFLMPPWGVEAYQAPGTPAKSKTNTNATVKAKAKMKDVEAPFEAAFDAAAKEAHLKPNEPGLIIAVVKGARPVFRRAIGMVSVARKTHTGPKTTFELASDTKMFTGYAILLLVDRGNLKLDEEVRTYLPEFPDYGPKHRIRVEHLVHHTSGLPEYFDPPLPNHGRRDYITNEDYARDFRALKARFQPTSVPGAKYHYCNTNYMLLALIVERVAKMPYSRFLKENIFDQMGMTGAWVHDRPNVTPRDPELGFVNAVGYERDNGRYKAS